MPEVVTHRYDPVHGACLNLCSLPDDEAMQVLESLRGKSRPNLKPDYLERRRAAEDWLLQAASCALKRPLGEKPVYFFLGDFSYCADPSRPAALVLPLSSLPTNSITFTLGDSMHVAEQPGRKVWKLEEIDELFGRSESVEGFGLSDRSGCQSQFIEMQVWERTSVLAQLPQPQASESTHKS